MLGFAHECVSNPKWNGKVRLILVETHEFVSAYQHKDKAERQRYWLQPEIRTDVRAVSEKYLAESMFQEWRQSYALYAYRGQAWDDLNAQLKLLGPIDYEVFGGRAAYDKVVAQAKAHTKP